MGKNIVTIYPLSASQKGMLIEGHGGQPGLHIEQAILELEGDLDALAFERAWNRVVERHAILRTAFAWPAQSEPVQVVLRRASVTLEQRDWRGLSKAQRDDELERYLDVDRRRGFSVKRAPLMRLALFRTEARRHQFVLTFHHVLMDGWSLALVYGEALAHYEALIRGVELSLPAPKPYRSYIAWLRERSSAEAKAHWRSYLSDWAGTTPLGPERSDVPAELPTGFDERTVELPPLLSERLLASAREHHITGGTLFQAAWSLLLARYSGQRDVVFGTTVSGRPPSLPGVLSMVGLFINTIPVRLQVPAAGSLWKWLQVVQRERANSREFDYCSSSQIHEWAELDATTPLYDSMLVFENYPEDTSVLADASLSVDMLESRTVGARTSYPLTILVGVRGGLTIKLIHKHNRIDAADRDRILRHFVALLASIAASPEPELSRLLARIPANEAPRPYPRFVARVGPTRPFTSPRDATELELAAIWRSLLGHDSIGVFDSFFDLGGHSLLGLAMMEKIHEHFGVRLPMATLLEFPTIDAIARRLRDSGEPAAWTPLVPIRSGGQLPPWFCVPGAAIDVISLHPLAHALDAGHPVYGIQPQGLDGQRPPLQSVEAMAAAAVEVIRATQPRGPYFIAGHSFGAHVAYEVSQQLLAAGCEIGLLALFDAQARSSTLDTAHPTRSDTDRLGRLLSLVRRFFGEDIELPAHDAQAGLEELIQLVATKLAEAKVLPAGRGVERIRAYLSVGEATALAFAAYRPRPRFPVRTILFRAREAHGDDDALGLGAGNRDDSLGWRTLLGDDITTRWVEGNHVTMMTQPHVEGLARGLHDALLDRSVA